MHIYLLTVVISLLWIASPLSADETAKASSEPQIITGPAVALDGNTLWMRQSKLRLFGINAPEMSAGGHIERGKLDDLLAGKIVNCRIVDHDLHIRPVGICGVAGGTDDLSQWLLEQGLASVYRTNTIETPQAGNYDAAERRARLAGRGIWERAIKPAEQNSSFWKRNESGIFGLFGVIIGALLSAGLGIYEIRRIRRDMRDEAAMSTAQVIAIELTHIKNSLAKADIAYSNHRSGKGDKILDQLPTNFPMMIRNAHRLGDLPSHAIALVVAAYPAIKNTLAEIKNPDGPMPEPEPLKEILEQLNEAIDCLEQIANPPPGAS